MAPKNMSIHNNKYTPEFKARVMKCVGYGLSQAAIAERFGISETGVSDIKYEFAHGHPRRRKKSKIVV